MTKMTSDGESSEKLLGIVADLLRGDRHSRRSIVAATGRSLPTADRWIEHIARFLPNVRRIRDGKTTLLAYGQRDLPSKTATVGACIAASLASVFEGSQQERNLKDARDYMLRLRGESHGDLDRKFFFAPKGGEYALPELRQELDEIVDAVLGGNRLQFSYRHNSGRDERLSVRPLTLVIFDHQFYVLARRDDGSNYCYRFARMSKVEAEAEVFEYPSKSEYDPRALFVSTFGIHIADMGAVENVEVLLSGPWAPYAMTHRWHPTQQVTKHHDGSVRIVLHVRVCPEVESWVLGFGEHAVVVKPAGLRDAVAARLRAAANAYATP